VQVDVVRHRVALVVRHGEVHRVADANADHRPRNLLVEGHVRVRDPRLDLGDDLLGRHLDVVGGGFVPVDGRRHVGRVRGDAVDVGIFGWVHGWLLGVLCSACGSSIDPGVETQPATAVAPPT